MSDLPRCLRSRTELRNEPALSGSISSTPSSRELPSLEERHRTTSTDRPLVVRSATGSRLHDPLLFSPKSKELP